MAEATALRNNALGQIPIYGQTYTVVFPMLDADGDLVTGATTPDAERSLNGDTFADCTNESTEIATNSGMYYLTLTAAEMTADIVSVIAKSATAGMKTTAIVLYPQKLVTVRSGTCNDDGSGTGDVVLDSGASAVDDYYNGMVIAVVIDGAASAEVRVITDYVGSTKTATVSPNWNTAIDNTDTFIIYLPPGQTFMPHVEKIYSDTTIVTSDLAEVDTSDIQSLLTKVYSDTNALNLGEGDISDILSRLTVTNSQLLIVKSDTSDIRSALVIVSSDTAHIESDAVRVLSDTTAIHTLATAINSDTTSLASDLAEGDFSDILSRLTVTNSQLLIVKSDTSDIRSALVIIASDTAAIEGAGGSLSAAQDSKLTRIASDLTEVDTSDIQSLLTKVYSDTNAISAAGGALTSDQDSKLTRVANAIVEVDTSDLMSMLTLIRSDTTSLASDLAEGDFSDILSRLTVTNSQLLVVKSDTSDIRSALVVIASDTAHIESDAVRILSDTSLATDARGEPGQGAPAVSATPQTKTDWLYKAFRNKTTQTATTYTLFNDDESTAGSKATVSDDGTTFTRTEVITGA